MHQTSGQAPKIGTIMGQVLNSSDIPKGILPANTLFVDKGTPYENPFITGVHGTKAENLSRYEVLLASSPETLQSLDHLKGKNLVVHNNDELSHGHVLAYLASVNYRARLEWADNILGDVELKLAA